MFSLTFIWLEAGPTFKTRLHREGSPLRAAIWEHQQDCERRSKRVQLGSRGRAGTAARRWEVCWAARPPGMGCRSGQRLPLAHTTHALTVIYPRSLTPPCCFVVIVVSYYCGINVKCTILKCTVQWQLGTLETFGTFTMLRGHHLH